MHMLNEHEKTEIDKEIAKFPIKQSACLEALMIVQHGRGYVSDESLKAVAEYLEMSATELDSIATFYNLIYRKPVPGLHRRSRSLRSLYDGGRAGSTE